MGTNFRGLNKNDTFVGFKIRGHSIFFRNSYRKLPFRGYWNSWIGPSTKTMKIGTPWNLSHPQDTTTIVLPIFKTDKLATVYKQCFFQLQYSANVKVVDHEGRNALWYARSSGSTECVELLINNGCPEHPTLPRRRGSSAQSGKNDVFEKLPASVIWYIFIYIF